MRKLPLVYLCKHFPNELMVYFVIYRPVYSKIDKNTGYASGHLNLMPDIWIWIYMVSSVDLLSQIHPLLFSTSTYSSNYPLSTPQRVSSQQLCQLIPCSRKQSHTHIYLSLQGRVNIFMRRPNSTVESSKWTANESLTAPLQNLYKEMGQTATCAAMFNNLGTNNLVFWPSTGSLLWYLHVYLIYHRPNKGSGWCNPV